MNAADLPHPSADAILSELAALGLQAARVLTRMMEIERAMADVAAGWLPRSAADPASWAEALAAGQGVDAVNAAMAEGVKRVEVLARAFDRVSRSVRRSVALMRRLEAGWPRGAADDRAAMVRRQVAHGVAAVIRRESHGEAAERLFDELAERLDERLHDPAFEQEILVLPVEEVVRRVCRDLGLVAAALRDTGGPLPPGSDETETDTS